MRPNCVHCALRSGSPDQLPIPVRIGRYYRKSDRKYIQRYRCRVCKRGFSSATGSACFNENKRHINDPLAELLCSGVSQRRAARLLRVSRTTIVRKFLKLARVAKSSLEARLLIDPGVEVVEFDDMETFEHTKCKPLSITLAVEFRSRRILGLEVSSMPCKGPLAAISRKKYGPRVDERPQARARLFSKLQTLKKTLVQIKSDENPHYPADVSRFFPGVEHERFKGKRGCIVGQGELKKTAFDPLFSFNHTAAKIRADVNRLARKTWCTTKRADRLDAHLHLYARYHNSFLAGSPSG